MKIVYNKEKTIARINDICEWYNKATARRNSGRLVNLAVVLSIMVVVAACYITGSTMPIVTGILLIVSLVSNIISTIMIEKSVPKDITTLCPVDAWYHFISEEYKILEVKPEKDGERHTVAIVIEIEGEPRTIELGTYDIKESPDVVEDTLDLEQEVVLIPSPVSTGTETDVSRS